GAAPHFTFQLPDVESESESESLEFDVVTSTLDSLLVSDDEDEDDFLRRSSSSSSLNESEFDNTNSSRRLPIFSRFSDSEK
ncbi:mCG142536, partial [Mus musculus]